jgi:type II secretory pathway pseudopilin PulG
VRKGVTLFELLVILALIGIILGLLLPGIDRTREAAGRAQCQNNLKQIGLAIHNYASTYQNQLPYLSDAPIINGRIHPQSLFFQILPDMEQDNMYKAGMSVFETWKAPILGGTIQHNGFVKAYVCSMDSSNSTTEARALYRPSGDSWVGSSYGANEQVFGSVTRIMGPDAAGNTAWAFSAVYNIGNIPDGTSNTIFVSERFALAGSGKTAIPCAWADPPANDGLCGGNPLCGPVFAFTLKTDNPPQDPLGRSGIGHPLPFKGLFGAVKYIYPLPEIGKAPQSATPGSAQSQHSAVVQVLMGDGSTRGVTSAVSQNTWLAALQPNDGELLGSDW